MRSFTFGPADMELDGYQISGPYLKAKTIGRATALFKGTEGRYQIAVSYLDESDGQGRFELEVDGKEAGQWQNNQDDDKVHSYVSPAVTLRPGSKVTVVGHQAAGEYARISRVRISTDTGSGKALRSKLGRGETLQLGGSLTEAAPDAREDVLASLRPLCPVAAAGQWPQKLLVNLTKAAPQGPMCVHLVNYDFKYDDKYALQSIQPATGVKLRAVGAKTARLLSPDGTDQVLQVQEEILEVPPVRIYSVLVLQ
jgi:hypothetical protein